MYPQEQVINFIEEIIENISSSGVFVLDRKTTKIITSNNAFAQIHGYNSSTDVNGLVLWDFLLPQDIQLPLNTLEQKGYFQGEVRAFTRGRDIISLDLTILDIRRFNIILGLVKDITKEQLSMKQLKESEATYRAFIENIHEGLMILDKHGKIVFVNPVLCGILKYHKTELINKDFFEVTHPEEFKSIEAKIIGREKIPLRHHEIKLKAKFGRDKTFLISTAPLYDSQSNYNGIIVVCVDITDRYLESDRLADTRGFLLKMIMSEISEQLLLTRGWLDILQASLPEQNERVDKLIGIIEKVIRLNRQISDFESLKPIFEYPLLLVSIEELINELNELINPLAESKGSTINFNLQVKNPNFYSCPRILIIAIEQIIQNSLERSSNEITIDIELASEKSLQLTITDDGRTFLKKTKSPKKSEFLMEIYLADVLLREIHGKLTINDILPKEGLQFSLICPLKYND
ncbi:MAG: PAS domain S-box protein [Promethearchaeota archaeon]